MGETRAKKPNKKSLKAQPQDQHDLPTKLADLTLLSKEIKAFQSELPPTLPSSDVRLLSLVASSKSSKESIDSGLSPSSSVITPQQLSNKLIKHDPSLFEVKNSQFKGLSVFATRRIPAGTLILAEVPVVRLTREHEDDLTADSVLESTFSSLPQQMQKQYLKLFDSQKAKFTRVKSIYYSNCYNLAKHSKYGGSCVGLIASRFNHSCIPNVQLSLLDAEDNIERDGQCLMLFHAIKTIPRGKEITSNYDTVFDTRESRRKQQMLHYGFKCDCEACEPTTEFWARSDARRIEMIKLRRMVRKAEKRWMGHDILFTEVEIKDVLDMLETMESVMLKEGLVGESLINVYKSLTKWAERAQDVGLAFKWRTKELETCMICFGEFSPQAKILLARLQET